MMFISLQDNIIQAARFWSSLLKPERKLDEIRKLEDFHRNVQIISKWLQQLFVAPNTHWTLEKATKNPNSEVFVFNQNQISHHPKRVFVKRFVVRLEKRNEIYPQGLAQETMALQRVSQFNGTHNVYIPKFYGQDIENCLMATSFLPGVSFFNVLCKPPIKVSSTAEISMNFAFSLSNLGKWLNDVHTAEISTKNTQDEIFRVLQDELSGIEMRITHLNKHRPADFPIRLCNKITTISNQLVKNILHEKPKPCIVHGDFAPSNMLYLSGQISVLDHVTCGTGLPENDLARMYLELKNIENFTYMFFPKLKGTLLSAFFSGYGKDLGEERTAPEIFYLIKYCVLNMYVFAKHWGNRQFLNPLLCRLFYGYQRRHLLSLLSAVGF